jgi:hypothetical protein
MSNTMVIYFGILNPRKRKYCYKKRLVSRINPSSLLKIILYNT